MKKATTRVLLIEDNPRDIQLVMDCLHEPGEGGFRIETVECVSDALPLLGQKGYSVILLDLCEAKGRGIETIKEVWKATTEVPIVALTDTSDEALGLRAVQLGAQDYLAKGEMDGPMLTRSLRHAIERSRLQTELLGQSLTDGLTGLSNRRGFMTLANQQIKLSKRMQREMILLYVDLDHLKRINDALGHQVGDLALIETATLLKETFRESDVMARVGGDEFAVLAVAAPSPSAQVLVARLRKNVVLRNAKKNRLYDLSLSVGFTRYDPASPLPLDVLLARADESMCEQKRSKEAGLPPEESTGEWTAG